MGGEINIATNVLQLTECGFLVNIIYGGELGLIRNTSINKQVVIAWNSVTLIQHAQSYMATHTTLRI